MRNADGGYIGADAGASASTGWRGRSPASTRTSVGRADARRRLWVGADALESGGRGRVGEEKEGESEWRI
jgi:hypothetical protein